MRKSGESFKILNRRIKNDQIDISHFKTGGYFVGQKKLSDESIFIKGDRDITGQIRLRLIKNKKIEYKCQKCGIKDKWLEEPIILELDHIDGDRYNNEFNNLRFLCPNCHSQTETFCGKKKKIKPIRVCACGNTINKFYKREHCANCEKRFNENLSKPSKEQLLLDIYSLDSIGLKNKYHVKLDKIKKWCLDYDIIYPHKNYWRMRNLGLTHEESLNYRKKIRKPMNLLDEKQVLEIKQLLSEDKLSLREIGRKFNKAHQTIMGIRDNKTYKEFDGRLPQMG